MGNIDPYLHAALVLHGAGKEISKESLLAILKAAGVEADEAKAKVLSEAVKGANIDELVEKSAMIAAAPAAAAPAEGKKEEEKEEVDEGKKEEQAAEGLANLFG